MASSSHTQTYDFTPYDGTPGQAWDDFKKRLFDYASGRVDDRGYSVRSPGSTDRQRILTESRQSPDRVPTVRQLSTDRVPTESRQSPTELRPHLDSDHARPLSGCVKLSIDRPTDRQTDRPTDCDQKTDRPTESVQVSVSRLQAQGWDGAGGVNPFQGCSQGQV